MQVYSSVGDFGTDTLIADTAAIRGSNTTYASFLTALTSLGTSRTTLADSIKQELFDAQFNNTPLPGGVGDQSAQCRSDIFQAAALANVAPPTDLPESPVTVLIVLVGLGIVGLFGALQIRRRRSTPAKV